MRFVVIFTLLCCCNTLLGHFDALVEWESNWTQARRNKLTHKHTNKHTKIYTNIHIHTYTQIHTHTHLVKLRQEWRDIAVGFGDGGDVQVAATGYVFG